jgi:hypothetical protein
MCEKRASREAGAVAGYVFVSYSRRDAEYVERLAT